MPINTFAYSCASRPARLAACIAATLGFTLSAVHAGETSTAAQHRAEPTFEGPLHRHETASIPYDELQYGPAQPPVRTVTSCADDGAPGTLRDEVNHAQSGDMIDLSTLACSTITLDSNWPLPELQVVQDTLYLKGPGDRHLTIDGGHHSSVFRHVGVGAGTLGITDLNITNGYYASNTQPNGGCIYSAHDVVLTRSVVSDCMAVSAAAKPKGGGIYTKGSLTLSGSTITNSAVTGAAPAMGPGVGAYAGGAFVLGDLQVDYSTISNNAATAKYANQDSVAGAVEALGNVTIRGSTISGNSADIVGGIGIGAGTGHSATITNSTISQNIANMRFGGLWTNVALRLDNSTVAFNHARASGAFVGAGVYSNWLLTLRSSIIAGNASENGPSDLGVGGLGALAAGSYSNLITQSTLPLPIGTVITCPKLQPLADNGGPTLTHALGHHSPAIDEGYNGTGLVTDQRFASRVVNVTTDIGSVEWQQGETDERIFVDGFDGLCDQ